MKALNIIMIAGILILNIVQEVPAAKIDPFLFGEPPLLIDRQCSINVNMPVIDYGVQSRWQLEESVGGKKVSLGKRNFILNVICPYSQTMSMIIRGASGHNGQLRYGENGFTSLRVMDVQLDGQTVELSSITPEGIIKDGVQKRIDLKPDTKIMITQNNQPIKGKVLTARFEIEPILAEKDARVSGAVQSESRLSFELLK